ncbi:alpha/beta hydrolase [Streptomyces sp. SID3212]|uniref:alpha/beta hydrolase n=1 Tax=Streptomyces sp. SID3212 TaxID=2690259 RepID=UPI0013697A68|nr:alpha/beta hydrolase [Streptomyces sp. SID3212]MYV51938.1 alpha/beta hydrolase [Streptomyces sp. SID3212]
MKPRLVFVHGIGGPLDSAAARDAERDAWVRALAEGARAAGHAGKVSALTQGWAADIRFAYYGDLFGAGQAQGGSALDPTVDQETVLLAELLGDAVDERLADPAGEDEIRVLTHARAQLDPRGAPQGPGSALRQTLNAANTLLSVPGLRTFGGWVSAKVMILRLSQVARYLARGEPDADGVPLDRRIRRRVGEALDPVGPTIVVSHSLGTVVALETLHEHAGPVPLFVTLGSPLGMRTAVLPKLRPRPAGVPGQVGRWLNFWDRDDFVAGGPRPEKLLRPNSRDVLPVSTRVDSDGVWVHPAVRYLAHPAVAGPVVEALEAATATGL